MLEFCSASWTATIEAGTSQHGALFQPHLRQAGCGTSLIPTIVLGCVVIQPPGDATGLRAKLVAHLVTAVLPRLWQGPAVYPECRWPGRSSSARFATGHRQCPGGAAQPSIPPQRPWRFGHSSCLARRGANHSDQRWATTLKSLDSRAADEEDQAGITGGSSAALTPASVPPAQTNLPAEGGMEGDSESHAQGDVAAGDREGVGNPQGHHQEIHGCRRSFGRRIPACSHCVPTSDTVAP